MKSIKAVFIFFLAGMFILSSCKNESALPKDALVHVPSTATIITSINVKQLMAKANFEEVKKMEFYQSILKEAGKENSLIAKAMENPELSGIDLEQKMYMASEFNEKNPEEMTTYFLFTLKNAGDFEKLFLSEGKEVKEADGIKFFQSSKMAMFAWNNDLAVSAFTNIETEDLQANVQKVFKTGKENSIAANKDLQKALNGNHDITSWLSTNSLADNQSAGMALGMLDLDPKALKDNYIHSYADFENGKITGHSDFSINKELGENFIGRFFKKETSTDFSKILPKENLAFATVMALDFKGIDQFFTERPQSKGYADFLLKEYGLQMKDLIAAFGGDVLVAGFSKGDLENARFLIATNLKDKKKAKEILQIAVQEKRLKEVEKDYYKLVGIGNEDFSITVNKGLGHLLLAGDMLCFSTDEAILAKIKSGGYAASEQAGSDVLGNFDDQTMGAWFAFNSVKDMVGGIDTNWFKEMKMKVNGNGADFILTTSDESANSLKTIFAMIDEAYKNRQKETQENI